MKILIVTGSRADLGLLHQPNKLLQADPYFQVIQCGIWGKEFHDAAQVIGQIERPDMVLLLGDRYEIFAVACACHLQRIPIAHIGGGDVTEGSYDNAMRDCISRLSTIHFATSTFAVARLVGMGCSNVHLVGNPGLDYIQHEKWLRERTVESPYVVVSYQPETIDDTVDLASVERAIAGRKAIWISPNPDRGSERIKYGESYSHDRFLSLLYYCDEFIGNSSAMYYEAPFLKPGGVPCRMIGKRQRGRCVPWGGEGRASERIRDVLRLWPSS
jgi:UDP-N-acetylglucosamine 2-epimerase